MSKFRFRSLDKYRIGSDGSNMTLAVPLPTTATGKAYRKSPSQYGAPYLFLIGQAPAERNITPLAQERMRRDPGTPITVCPYSGDEAPSNDFLHETDLQAVQEFILWAALKDAGDFLSKAADRINRQKHRNLIALNMEITGHKSPAPRPIREDLLRNIFCNCCHFPYGVYAIALFCPDCGAPNLASHFTRETELVKQQVSLAHEQEALGNEELSYRLLGNAHEDILTAYEAALKIVFRYLVRQRQPEKIEEWCTKQHIGNKCQNIERTQKLFAPLGTNPFQTLNEEEITSLRQNIEKRHVIGHNLGIADEHYAKLTNEDEPGQTVTLLAEDITRFASTCATVIHFLDDTLVTHTKQHVTTESHADTAVDNEQSSEQGETSET